MTSTVTNYSNNINAAYPIAGIDNDTQGFRENFTNIKNSLGIAATEISDLQSNTVKLNTGTNDFNYYSLYRASLIGSGQASPAVATISTNTNISFYQGSYRPISVTSDVTITVTDWPPTNTKGSIEFEIVNGTNFTRSLTFSAGSGVLKKEASVSNPISLPGSSSAPVIYELWTRDNGATVYMRKVGGPFL